VDAGGRIVAVLGVEARRVACRVREGRVVSCRGYWRRLRMGGSSSKEPRVPG
jgi:hypothetical protein